MRRTNLGKGKKARHLFDISIELQEKVATFYALYRK